MHNVLQNITYFEYNRCNTVHQLPVIIYQWEQGTGILIQLWATQVRPKPSLYQHPTHQLYQVANSVVIGHTLSLLKMCNLPHFLMGSSVRVILSMVCFKQSKRKHTHSTIHYHGTIVTGYMTAVYNDTFK